MEKMTQGMGKKLNSFGFPRKSAFFLLLVMILMLTATAVAQEGGVGGDVADPQPVTTPGDVLPAVADTTTPPIYASKDAFISSLQANTNFGYNTTMGMGYAAGTYSAMRLMLEFNLSSIPAQATINSATMYIYQQSTVPHNDGDMGFKAQYMKQQWSENAVTWNNANYLGGDEITIGQNNSALGWKTSDVTTMVQAWHNGSRPNYGFIITGDEGPQNNRSRFFRTNNWGGYRPYLVVNYSQCSDLTPPTATINPLPTWSPGSFDVSWTGSDNGAGIAYYDIEYNVNAGSWGLWLSQTTATSATYSGATNAQQYQFRARAADNCGNVGAWTGAQAWTNVDSIAPTATVAALNPYTFGSSFTVNWSGSDNAGGSGIASYDVQASVNGGGWQNWISGTGLTSAQVTGAQQGDTFGFQARARDVAGNVGSYPNYPQASTTIVLHSVAVVNQFNPSITDQSSFNVTWAGYHAPGVTINSYDVNVKFNNGPWELFYSGSQTSSLFDTATEDGIYWFEARARDSNGTTEPFTGQAEANMVVDSTNSIQPAIWMPLIYK